MTPPIDQNTTKPKTSESLTSGVPATNDTIFDVPDIFMVTESSGSSGEVQSCTPGVPCTPSKISEGAPFHYNNNFNAFSDHSPYIFKKFT